jgi:hypothetical protein
VAERHHRARPCRRFLADAIADPDGVTDHVDEGTLAPTTLA